MMPHDTADQAGPHVGAHRLRTRIQSSPDAPSMVSYPWSIITDTARGAPRAFPCRLSVRIPHQGGARESLRYLRPESASSPSPDPRFTAASVCRRGVSARFAPLEQRIPYSMQGAAPRQRRLGHRQAVPSTLPAPRVRGRQTQPGEKIRCFRHARNTLFVDIGGWPIDSFEAFPPETAVLEVSSAKSSRLPRCFGLASQATSSGPWREIDRTGFACRVARQAQAPDSS